MGSKGGGVSDPGVVISEDEAATLARWAGLTMPPERLPQLALNLKAARGAVADLALAGIDPDAPVAGPFDPSWPDDEADAS
jgi:hypothetical protein